MHRFFTLFCLLGCLTCSFHSFSQVGVGEWRSHISYNTIRSLAASPEVIYASSGVGVQIYRKNEDQFQHLSTVNGLSAASISEMYYSNRWERLFIGYKSGAMDVLKNEEITDYSQISEQSFYSNTVINHFMDFRELLLLGTDFGVVEFDPTAGEFLNTYNLRDGAIISVYDLAMDADFIYAASQKGVFFAPKDADLTRPTNWTRMDFLVEFDQPYNTLEVFNGELVVNYSNDQGNDRVYLVENNSSAQLLSNASETVEDIDVSNDLLYIATNQSLDIYNSQLTQTASYSAALGSDLSPLSVLTDNSSLWLGDAHLGLLKHSSGESFLSFRKNGPPSNSVFRSVARSESAYFSGGGYKKNMAKNNLPAWLAIYNENTWSGKQYSELEDLTDIAVDPGDPAHVYAGSWGGGLAEFSNLERVSTFDESNSALSTGNEGDVRVHKLIFDEQNNLWMINHDTEHPVVVKTNENEWVKHEYDVLRYYQIGDFVLDAQNSFKWGFLPENNAVFVIDDNGTPSVTSDDRVKVEKPLDQNGNLYDYKNDDIYAMAQDLAGYIWIATEGGMLVETNPSSYFRDEAFKPSRVTISENGNSNYLLRDNEVTDILVDPGNRKWIATARSGVFLFSEEGSNMVKHFTTENSPLFSNTIYDISLEEENGELFFVTSKGLISYRGEASRSANDFKDAYVFPNPVKPGYEGPITITGLIENVNVKITDISGNLVYETVSQGGQAIWHGKSLSGRKVSSGVYLVFISNEDGSKTHIEKILFIK